MNENFDQQKKEIPAPPTPEISIRTMESDIKALEQGGGEMVAPKTFSQEKEFNIPGYAGPEKPIFSSMAGIAPKQAVEEPGQTRQGQFKFLITLIIVILAAIAIGFLVYFVFSKWIFSA